MKNPMNKLGLKTLLLLLFVVSLPAKTFAEDPKSERKVIKTSFFTIELPERFTHLEGGEDDLFGYTEGKFFATTKNYFPMANKITSDGSCVLLEYGNSTKGEPFKEKELLSQYFQNYIKEFKHKDISPHDLKKFEKPRILEQNKLLTTAYLKIYHFDNESKLPMHGYSYMTFFKTAKVAVWYAYFDSNDEETGRKAAQEIYEQIKKTSLEINPPKPSSQNQFNP